METTVLYTLKLGDVGYVKFKGTFYRYTIVAIHEEFGGTLSIANGVGEATCRQSEFVPEALHLANKLKAEEPEARQRLAPILAAWEAGHRDCHSVAKYLKENEHGGNYLTAATKMLECHRRGFIQLPIVDGLPTTKPQKHESEPSGTID